MSEKEQLLPQPPSGAYYTQSRPVSTSTFSTFTAHANRSCDKAENVLNRLLVRAVRKLQLREFMAEFLATFILMTFGNGAVAQVVLSAGGNGSELTINIGYGLGVVMGCYVAIGITGAHMNPAVTFAMALRRKTAWIKVIPYWIAQFFGAFVSSVVIYAIYYDAIYRGDFIYSNKDYCFHNGSIDRMAPLCTGKIWATYPTPSVHLSLGNGFADQVLGTFLLLLGIFAICDSQNSEPKAGLKPLLIGLLVWAIGGSFGLNCGYAINPARDFGPRIFTAIAGWGKDVFVCKACSFHHWWWVPIVAPMVGAALATLLYWVLIEAHHPQNQRRPLAARVNAPTDSNYEYTYGDTNGEEPPSPTFNDQ